MGTKESLSLLHRFEAAHPPLPNPGRLMGLLCPIVLILLSAMDRAWYQLSMGDTIAAQFVCNYLSWLCSVAS